MVASLACVSMILRSRGRALSAPGEVPGRPPPGDVAITAHDEPPCKRARLGWSAGRGLRDDPAARLALMARVFRGPTGAAPRHLPVPTGRKLSFMRWQASRGVPRSPRRVAPRQRVGGGAVNERLPAGRMRDGRAPRWVDGEPSSQAVRLWWSSARDRRGGTGYRERTTRASWPDTRSTGTSPTRRVRPERFFMNVALVRELYAHALAAAPLALGPLAPARSRARRPSARDGGRVPLSPRVLPDRYPLALDGGALYRRRAAPGPDARLRGDRSLIACTSGRPRSSAKHACSSWCARATLSTLQPFPAQRHVWRTPEMPLAAQVFERVTRAPLRAPTRAARLTGGQVLTAARRPRPSHGGVHRGP